MSDAHSSAAPYVVRTDTEHVCVGGVWFRASDLRDALMDVVRAAGSRNPVFDMPGALYTGSPWGEVLLSLGVAPVPAPSQWRAVVLPKLGEVWRARRPLWETLWPAMKTDKEAMEGPKDE